MAGKRVRCLGRGRVDHLGRLHPLGLGVDRLGLDPRHVDDVLEQPVQADQLSPEDLGLFPAAVLVQPRRAQVVGRHGGSGERRLQIVAERRQQRRLQFGVAPDRFGLATLFEQAGDLVALDLDLVRPSTRLRRQVAGNQADGEQREERHPMRRIGHRKRAHRRQEEEIEQDERRQRCGDRHPAVRHRGDHEDDQQVGERDRRRVPDAEPHPVDGREPRRRRQRQEQVRHSLLMVPRAPVEIKWRARGRSASTRPGRRRPPTRS